MTAPGPVAGRRKHATDRLATGNPVYRGASNAATSGTVDPSGYLERGRRSGLARSLLARTQAQAPGTDGAQLVGETASRTDRGEVVRRLAARMARPRGV